jgi:nudix-type nucleoside diphosphatase (YffH/AdpP family)
MGTINVTVVEDAGVCAIATARVAAVDVVLQGWINVRRVSMAMPDGALVERHVEDHGPGVAVLPYDSERRTALLISQPRAPVILGGEAFVLEAIAGRLDGADPVTRIRAEAIEEAGVDLGSLEHVVRIWTMPSISTERLDLFLAPYTMASRTSQGGGCNDEHENITVHELSLARLAQDADLGRLSDGKTLILVQALRLRKPALFA